MKMKKTYLKISTIVCLIAYGGGASLKADSISTGSSVSTTQPIQSFNINLQTALSFSKDKAKSSIEEQFKALNENKAKIEKEFDNLNQTLTYQNNNIISQINLIKYSLTEISNDSYQNIQDVKQLTNWINYFKETLRNTKKSNFWILQYLIDSDLNKNGTIKTTEIQSTNKNIRNEAGDNAFINLMDLQRYYTNLATIQTNIQTNQTNLQATKDKIAQYDTLIAQITTLAKIQQKAISTIHSEQKTLSS
ncbi:hypothetical protein, partial [Helicobacter sp. 13S00477-4]|uniref:hypothetical protein n=1 Tax=Helicobacter sp. 13S00477-4 TaxID=1905759 RepID=UPI001179F72B